MTLTRRRWLAALPWAGAAWAQQGPAIYDLLLKNGHVLDPKNRRNGRLDVAVAGGKIVRVAPNLPAAHAKLVVEAGDYYVTPGLIDIRAHFHPSAEGEALQPDHHALTNGVTTAVTPVALPSGARGGRGEGGVRTRLIAWTKAAGQPVLSESPEGLREGDILTGIYGRTGIEGAKTARQRGVLLDTGSFWFRVAAPAVREGFLPDTISTNLHKGNILLERANMMTTLSKFLNLGLTVEQLVERTTVNAARAIRRPELGHLDEGAAADIAVLALDKGKFGFVDAGHARLDGDRRLRCVLTVRAGRVVWDADGLSLTEWTHAGPYSNFR
jgi:predicted amidohydrolase